MRNVSLLVAIAVNAAGHREILGIVVGAKEDLAGWKSCKRGKICGSGLILGIPKGLEV